MGEPGDKAAGERGHQNAIHSDIRSHRKPRTLSDRRSVFATNLMQIKALDHIIIGDNKYFSFADQGLINAYLNSLSMKRGNIRKRL